jgi:hypothetical protein
VGLFHIRNLIAMRRALDIHNASCPEPARAILLNPIDHGLLGWDELWGLPVLSDETVRVKRIQIDCAGGTRERERETPAG